MSEAVKHMWQRLAIVVLLLFIVWGRCGGTTEPQDINVVTYTDTTYITHVDTTFFLDTTYVTQTVLLYTTIDSIPGESGKLYTFKNQINDSLLTGEISTKIKIREDSASLLSQGFVYTPKFPKYIHQIDSVFIKDSTVVTKADNKMHLLLGADFGYGTSGALIAPKLALQLRNKSIIEIGYDPFNKQAIIGTKIKLQFKRKN